MLAGQNPPAVNPVVTLTSAAAAVAVPVKMEAGLEKSYNTLYVDSENNPSPWAFYVNTQNVSCAGYPKVHFSLYGSAENLNKAAAIIFPILMKHKVAQFKLLTVASLERFVTNTVDVTEEDLRNVFGKELTIYLRTIDNDGIDSSFWLNVFRELEEALLNAGVKPNEEYQSVGSQCLLGSEFVNYRDQDNIFDIYVSTRYLAQSGFTRSEAANLTGRFQALFKIPETKVAVEAKSITLEFASVVPEHKTICSQYDSDIQESLPAFFGDQDIEITSLNRRYVLPFVNLFSPSDETEEYKNTELKEYYQSCLNEAAVYTAKIISALTAAGTLRSDAKDDGFKPGIIAPAVYYHFIKPIVQRARATNTELSVNSIDRERFISELVKCSLRKRSAQIDSIDPQYIANLTSAQVDSLVTQVKQTPVEPSSHIASSTGCILDALSGSSPEQIQKAFSSEVTVMPYVPSPLLATRTIGANNSATIPVSSQTALTMPGPGG